MSKESIKNPPTSDSSFAPNLINYRPLPDPKFGGKCLRQSGISVHKNVVNLYISYRLDLRGLNTDFTLGNCLLGAVKLTKNADPNKYRYSGYGIRFDARSQYSLPGGN